MNVIIVGDNSSPNLGDPVLTRCTEYLIHKVLEHRGSSADDRVIIFDIAARKSRSVGAHSQSTGTKSAEREKEAITQQPRKRTQTIVNLLSILKWVYKDRSNFRRQLLSHVDKKTKTVFVIAGGALLSYSSFYALRLNEIVNIASRIDGKVVFNAIGVEKCSKNCFSRRLAKRFLAKKEVVAFSTRDGCDDSFFSSLRPAFQMVCADSGLWAAETFKTNKKDGNVIGVGVISSEAYRSVTLEEERAKFVTTETLFAFWYSVITGIEARGEKWRIFTNGGQKDVQIARAFLKRYGFPIDIYMIPPPETGEELVKQISQFKAVVAHRLHALIISSALGIPTVPLVWSKKIQRFSDLIRNEKYYWPSEDVAESVSQSLCNALFNDNDAKRIEELKTQLFEFLSSAIKLIEERE